MLRMTHLLKFFLARLHDPKQGSGSDPEDFNLSWKNLRPPGSLEALPLCSYAFDARYNLQIPDSMLESAPPSAVKVLAKYVNHLHVQKFMNIPTDWQGICQN